MRFLLFALLALLLPANFALATPARPLPIAGPLEFSRDGKQLTAVLRDFVDLSLIDERMTWDVATGRALHRRPFEMYTRVLHAPDGETYAKGGYQHRTFIGDDKGAISQLSNSERICILEAEPGEKVSPLAFSPDGQLLAAHSNIRRERAATRTTVGFWDTRTGKRLRQLEDPQSTMLHAVFSADGRRVVTLEQRETDDYVVVRQRATGKLIKTFPIQLAFRISDRYFDISPDGRFLLTTDIDEAPLSFGGPLGTPIPTSRNWAFKLCLWNLDTGTLAHTFLVPQFGSGLGMPGKFSSNEVMRSDWDTTTHHFSSDGTRLQIALFNRVAPGFETLVWDTQTGVQVSRRTLATTSRIYSAAFSPDGKRLAVATTDGKIELRDAFSLAFIRQWDVKLEGERLPSY